MKFILFTILIIATFILSCNSYNNTEREAMIKAATQFLEVVKTNDTSRVKSMLLYGLTNNDNFGFAYNVNSASEAINKYGIPQSEKISLDSSVHNVPTTIAVIFPLYLATNPEDEFQKAVTKVFVQKISGEYKIVFFSNEFQNKITPIEQ